MFDSLVLGMDLYIGPCVMCVPVHLCLSTDVEITCVPHEVLGEPCS